MGVLIYGCHCILAGRELDLSPELVGADRSYESKAMGTGGLTLPEETGGETRQRGSANHKRPLDINIPLAI